jgi:cytochrome oxidase Cu insertion factor (SCO1/SenC/PrrC family)
MEESPMSKTLMATALTLAMLLAASAAASPPEDKPAPAPMKIKVGDMAPDFTLLAFDGQGLKRVSLHDYRGKKNVALAFYVFAFGGT